MSITLASHILRKSGACKYSGSGSQMDHLPELPAQVLERTKVQLCLSSPCFLAMSQQHRTVWVTIKESRPYYWQYYKRICNFTPQRLRAHLNWTGCPCFREGSFFGGNVGTDAVFPSGTDRLWTMATDKIQEKMFWLHQPLMCEPLSCIRQHNGII